MAQDSFSILFDRATLAESLWEYGEDEAAEDAMRLDEAALQEVQRLAARRYDDDPEPLNGPRLTNGRIIARAGIEFITGESRDTARRRRRTRPRAESFLG
ncbi:MAG: hypothetical protein ACRDMZ_08485 [Solirubrobacteraceae bacterium]